MAETMFMLVIKHTGHVLAAMTELPDGAEPTLEEVCGEDFEVGGVRSNTNKSEHIGVPITREQLDLVSAPFDAAVLANPRGYVADGASATRISAAPPSVTAAAFSSTEVNHASFAAKTLVALNLADDPQGERRLALGPETAPFAPIKLKTSPSAGVESPIAAGGSNYDAMVAVPGLPLVVLTVSI